MNNNRLFSLQLTIHSIFFNSHSVMSLFFIFRYSFILAWALIDSMDSIHVLLLCYSDSSAILGLFTIVFSTPDSMHPFLIHNEVCLSQVFFIYIVSTFTRSRFLCSEGLNLKLFMMQGGYTGHCSLIREI